MILSNDELTSIRSTIATMLPDTCTIMSRTLTGDGAGGQELSYGTAYAGVACRLDYISGNERGAGGAIQPFSGWILTLPYTTTINETDQVVISGETYNVMDVDSGKSWQASVRCKVQKV